MEWTELPLTASALAQALDELEAAGCERMPVGESVWGRPIEAVSLGTGPRRILALCGVHATETIAGWVLLHFLSDLAQDRPVSGIPARRFLSRARITVIPLLNPDGASIARGEIGPGDERYARLCFYNDGSPDFSHWQANASGVDLNHNFDAGFEEGCAAERELGIYGPSPTRFGGRQPFSEPETRLVRDLVAAERFDELYAFHTQGEEIYYTFKGYAPPGAREKAGMLARVSGYRAASPQGIAALRGAKDWFIAAYDRPGFTVELGRGQNPLPEADGKRIYRRVGELLMLTGLF